MDPAIAGGISGAGSAIVDQFAAGMESNDSLKGIVRAKVIASINNARIAAGLPAQFPWTIHCFWHRKWGNQQKQRVECGAYQNHQGCTCSR